MKNKGFTLIELLGVITLISLIVLIIIPAASKTVKKGSDVAQKQTIESIILSAKNWASDHKEELPKEPDATYGVKVIDLQKGGYIDKDIDIPLNITNDASETEKNEAKNKACVQITNIKKNDDNKNIYNYTYESECNNSKPCQILLNDVKAPAKETWFNTPVTVTVKNANGNEGYISTDPNTDYGTIDASTDRKTNVTVDDTNSAPVKYYGYVQTPNGQSKSCSATFGIDRVAPTCNIYGVSENSEATIQPQDNTITTNGNIKLKGVCSDDGSECANNQDINTTALESEQLTTTKEQETFSNVKVKDGEGNSQVCDNAGNCTQCPSVNVEIDKDTPDCTITATTNPNSKDWYQNDVELELVLIMRENGNNITLDSTTAEKYGIVKYVIDTKENYNPTANLATKTAKSTGTYIGSIITKDNKTRTCYKKINIDKEAPTCTVGTYKKNSDGVFNTKVTDWVNVNVKVKGVCKDTGGSKCVTNQDDLTNTPVKTDKYTKNTNTSVSPGKVCDNAGHCTTCGKSAVKVDVSAPTKDDKYQKTINNGEYSKGFGYSFKDNLSGFKPIGSGSTFKYCYSQVTSACQLNDFKPQVCNTFKNVNLKNNLKDGGTASDTIYSGVSKTCAKKVKGKFHICDKAGNCLDYTATYTW